MNCFDDNCVGTAAHEIRGLQMCTTHYIEALEHSAHLTSVVTGDDHPIKVQIKTPRKTLDIPETLK